MFYAIKWNFFLSVWKKYLIKYFYKNIPKENITIYLYEAEILINSRCVYELKNYHYFPLIYSDRYPHVGCYGDDVNKNGVNHVNQTTFNSWIWFSKLLKNDRGISKKR